MRSISTQLTLVLCVLAIASSAQAVDGVVEINQAQVAAGGITPGDAPGFPVTLSRAGSYRLTSNLATGSKNLTAILITTDHVSVDLNGFTIACTFATALVPSGCLTSSGTGSGVLAEPGPSPPGYITVRNGAIREMGDFGVFVGFDSRIVDLIVESNGGSGVVCESGCIVKGNIVRDNRYAGIASRNGVIAENIVTSNGQTGISGGGGTVIGNTVRQNGGGLFGGAFEDNHIAGNNGAQVFGSEAIAIGANVCGTDTNCP